ncbi:MAG TPA: hypothetical protein VFU73_00130 [Actinocrinis sp.]|nr:hypothetical protein [Actinocrinis sp.]
MAPGSAAGSTPAPESDSERSDPAPGTGTAPDGSGPDRTTAPDANDRTAEAAAAAEEGSGAVSEVGAKAAGKAPRTPAAGLTGGIGCAALLLPLVAVAGAVLCFAAGILSTAGGCSPNGSALCSSNGAWYSFALPVFISPLISAVAAIGAVTVRRHRSTWLAVGYGIVFVSIIIGLASASTGSH